VSQRIKDNIFYRFVLQLLKAVKLEDFKTSDVEDADKASPLTFGAIQRFVEARDNPLEEPLKGGLGNSLHSKLHLFLIKIKEMEDLMMELSA